MLEHVPAWLGHALRGLRAGADKLAAAQPGLAAEAGDGDRALRLSSPAFANGARLPPRFTADGEGASPPLVWGEVPPGTASLALLVEDVDAPAPQPLVHAVVWGIAADAGRLAEGAIGPGDPLAAGPGAPDVGRNSFRGRRWLPPDPPTGHGDHRYVFQLFALDASAGDPGEDAGRAALIGAMAGHVLGVGLLVGTYARGEPAAASLGAVPATAAARAG